MNRKSLSSEILTKSFTDSIIFSVSIFPVADNNPTVYSNKQVDGVIRDAVIRLITLRRHYMTDMTKMTKYVLRFIDIDNNSPHRHFLPWPIVFLSRLQSRGRHLSFLLVQQQQQVSTVPLLE